jgi:hypothetical protein
MRGILADADVEGHWRIILGHLKGDMWREIWISLNLRLETFETLGMSIDAADEVVWQICQQRELVLVTNNRTQNTTDSLEATIRAHNTPNSLPVFTLANAPRILQSSTYAERVTEQLLEYLLRIDTIRGTGRLYLP